MKRKSKLCFIIMTAILMLSYVLSPISIQAVSDDNETLENVLTHVNETSQWGQTKSNGYLNINGNDFKLLVTFNDQKKAMNSFKSQYRNELKKIKLAYGYEELNDSNFTDYYAVIKENDNIYFKSKDVNVALGFFDLYENYDLNIKIKDMARSLNSKSINFEEQQSLLEEIDALSPSYNKPLSIYNKTRVVTHLSSINVKNATAYAKKYASTPNKSYKYYNRADCTNFASQIAYAGGLRNGTAWKPYTGAWTIADSFAITWGKKGKSTKWSNFVKTVKPGNFIGIDYGGDGVMDHVGYVAANGPSSSTKYIAQHSNDYYRLSSAFNCGWKNDSPTRILWIIGNP